MESQKISQENSAPALSVISNEISLQFFFQNEWSCTTIQIIIGSNNLSHDLFSTLASLFKDFLCSFAEITTDANRPFFKLATKKRKLSTTDAFAKIEKASEAFVSYQHVADRSFLAAEEAQIVDKKKENE